MVMVSIVIGEDRDFSRCVYYTKEHIPQVNTFLNIYKNICMKYYEEIARIASFFHEAEYVIIDFKIKCSMPVIVKYRVYLLQFRERGLKYVLAVRVVCSNPNRVRYQTLGTDTKIYYFTLSVFE